MKPKDLGLIAGAIVLGIVVSVVVSKLVFVSPTSGQQVDIVPTLPVSFPSPDSRYFNKSSLDPTQFIRIGNNSNPNPFSAGTNN